MSTFDKLLLTICAVVAAYMAFNTSLYSEERYLSCRAGGYSWTTCQAQAFN
jgi:hypothetical protein